MSQLLQNAAYGTAMILTVMILRRVLKDRLSPAARLALWGVCLFRLLTPAAPESVLSLWGLVGRLAPAPAEVGTQSAPAPAVTGPVYVPEPGMPVTAPAPAVPPALPANPAAAQAAFPWGTVLTAVWLAVGIAVGLWYAAGWFRARRAVNCAIPVGEDDPRRRFLPRFAQLREGPVEGAPLTFGVVRPQVVLSPGLDAGEQVCVLAHEGVHARRRDNLWHYAMAAALVVHWWNPAVWLMPRLLRRDIELACDRAALKKLGEDCRVEYAQALVTLSTQGEGNGPAFCQSFGRKATEERIRSIMKFKKPTIIGVVLTLVLVLGVSIAFASDPKTPEDDNKAADMSAGTPAGEAIPFSDELAKPVGEDTGVRVQVTVSGLLCTQSGCTANGVHQHDSVVYDACAATCTSEQYAAALDAWVTLGVMTRQEADGWLDIFQTCYDHVQAGDSDAFHYNIYNGEKMSAAWYISDRAKAGYPVNSKGETYGSGAMSEVYGSSPDLILAMGTSGEEGYIRNGEGDFLGYPGGVNNPEEAMAYMEWKKTQPETVYIPLYDCEGNEIGKFAMSNSYGQPGTVGYLGDAQAQVQAVPACGVPGCTETGEHHHENGEVVHHYDTLPAYPVYPVCHVDGCAAVGQHTHNGVTYCGGSGHHGDTCDGSCTYQTLASMPSDGHHEESRHGSNHH